MSPDYDEQPAVAVTLAVDASSVSFLTTGSTTAAVSFISQYTTDMAAVAGVNPATVSLSFIIDYGAGGVDTIPASNFLSRRRLQGGSAAYSIVTTFTAPADAPSGGADYQARVQAQLATETAETFSAALTSVTVLAIESPPTAVIARVYPPPAPSPAPPSSGGAGSTDIGGSGFLGQEVDNSNDDDDDDEDRNMIIGASVVGGILVVVALICACVFVNSGSTSQSPAKSYSSTAAPVQNIQMASVTASSSSAESEDKI